MLGFIDISDESSCKGGARRHARKLNSLLGLYSWSREHRLAGRRRGLDRKRLDLPGLRLVTMSEWRRLVVVGWSSANPPRVRLQRARYRAPIRWDVAEVARRSSGETERKHHHRTIHLDVAHPCLLSLVLQPVFAEIKRIERSGTKIYPKTSSSA